MKCSHYSRVPELAKIEFVPALVTSLNILGSVKLDLLGLGSTCSIRPMKMNLEYHLCNICPFISDKDGCLVFILFGFPSVKNDS